ncbi:MAG: BatA domain-containing protein [Opitutaceae bacterium]|nr:BatA domain-containing protein [Opitutaceae bacterium]
MIPIFAHPAGLWLLLGLPAILAIHFLQQRSRLVRTSTWFLIERLAPDSARGRTWEQLRSSRTLWLQLAAIILASWVLAEPRWVQTESAQTVVLVLDASASMDAFRPAAAAAAEREMTLSEGLAARTTWVVMTTNPRQPPLYRGLDRSLASAAIASWRPELGRHDIDPALRLARGLAGASGRTLLITDRRDRVPPDQRAAGVGRRIENVGFAGATVTPDKDGVMWRALVKNHTATTQVRSWRLTAGLGQSPEQTITLAPGAIAEISARLPDGIEEATVVLSTDGFAADDRLPLVRPAPKPLAVDVDGTDETAEFFRKLARDVPGVTIVSADAMATLRLARASQDEVQRERRSGIFWPPADQRAQMPLLTDVVTAERDALVAGLNWQGWLGTGTHGFAPARGDTVLLWHGKWPLVILRAPSQFAATTPPAAVVAANRPDDAALSHAPTRKLLLAFDWSTSNAARLPAMVLLARRFIEAERDAQPAPFAANFDCGALVTLRLRDAAAARSDETRAMLMFTPAAGGPAETIAIGETEAAGLRAPRRPGFFRVTRGNDVLVRGSAQFADPRQGDFRTAETFFVELRRERDVAIERNTRGDPLAVLWLILLAGVVLASWWVRTAGTRAAGEPLVASNA